MSYPAFPNLTPSTTTQLQKNYRALFAQFGGNYSQVAPDGINSSVPTWFLQFDNLDSTDSSTLEAFLESVGMFNFFTWTPPSGNGSVWRIDPKRNSYSYQKTTNGVVNSYSFAVTMVY